MPLLTLTQLINVHLLTSPVAPLELQELPQEVPMTQKGTLGGVWTNVFLHSWSWSLSEGLPPQEATDMSL